MIGKRKRGKVHGFCVFQVRDSSRALLGNDCSSAGTDADMRGWFVTVCVYDDQPGQGHSELLRLRAYWADTHPDTGPA